MRRSPSHGTRDGAQPMAPGVGAHRCTRPSGEAITLETRDGLDGQIGRDSTAAPSRPSTSADGHPLTGPVHVEGDGEPGTCWRSAVLERPDGRLRIHWDRSGVRPASDGFSRSISSRRVSLKGRPGRTASPGITVPPPSVRGQVRSRRLRRSSCGNRPPGARARVARGDGCPEPLRNRRLAAGPPGRPRDDRRPHGTCGNRRSARPQASTTDLSRCSSRGASSRLRRPPRGCGRRRCLSRMGIEVAVSDRRGFTERRKR